MREIKFRAWNTETKTIIDLKKITPLAINMDFDGLFLPFADDFILMQYTGLKDKNGKEIYEGDIVRARYIESKEYYKNEVITIEPTETTRGYWEDCEVIGNIYENKELL
ncbi:hypothetical protein LCGC14_0364560 [marine sediment metagenome]|uniref:YopX protein domain-containing protein n=1 Tax=marine sediment metagenome TaxID=412755 RepID=A0A0F9TCQ5_9ZZZZ